MLMKKIISLSIIASLTATGFLMITSQEINDGATLKADEMGGLQNNSTSYSNHLEFNQDNLQLKKEVVQYEITFHQDDVIDFSSKMAVLYDDETITATYCLLTDGEKPLMEPACLWYVPERKYLIVTPRIHLSAGRFLLIQLFKDKVGRSDNKSGYFDVQSGDRWYLTLAVPTTSEKSYFSVVIESLYDSMEVTQLTRHGNVGLYSPTYNQFSGKYYAIKLNVFFGASVCDIFKEITVRDGSVFHIVVAGHRKGSMTVYLPDGEEKEFNQKRIMEYAFLGNDTGTWRFTVKGWSFYFRMVVVLFYIDIDPHIKNE